MSGDVPRMSGGRMRLRATAYRVGGPVPPDGAGGSGGAAGSHGPHRLLTPRRPLPGRLLVVPPEERRGYGLLTGGRAALLHLGAWFRIAAVSPRSAVWIPVPDEAPPPCRPDGAAPPRPRAADLVLARSETGLRPADWRALRTRARRGPPPRPLTLTVPAPLEPAPFAAWQRPRHRLLTLTAASGALVLRGPAELLFDAGDALTDAGERLAGTREVHRHGRAHLTDLTELIRTDTGALPHLLQVVGEDPLFHRSRWQKQRNQRSESSQRNRPTAAARSRRRRPVRPAPHRPRNESEPPS